MEANSFTINANSVEIKFWKGDKGIIWMQIETDEYLYDGGELPHDIRDALAKFLLS